MLKVSLLCLYALLFKAWLPKVWRSAFREEAGKCPSPAQLPAGCRGPPELLLDPGCLLACPGTWVGGMPWREPHSDSLPASAHPSHASCNFAGSFPVLRVLEAAPSALQCPCSVHSREARGEDGSWRQEGREALLSTYSAWQRPRRFLVWGVFCFFFELSFLLNTRRRPYVCLRNSAVWSELHADLSWSF